MFLVSLLYARSAARGGAPLLSKSIHPRKFRNHVTVHRSLADPRSAPQGDQRLLPHILARLGALEKTNCTSMLWPIDSCQNRASADKYHLTVPRAQVSNHRGRVFFEVIPWKITNFKWSQAQVYFFPMIHIKYVVFMSLWFQTIRILISNWPRTRKFSQCF